MNKRILFILLFFVFLFCNFSFPQVSTFTSVDAGGNWESPATWTEVGSDVDNIPDADDIVIVTDIGGGGPAVVTINSVAACSDLTIGNSANNATLTIAGVNSLAVGDDLMFNTGDDGGTYTLNVNAGALTVADLVTTVDATGTKDLNITTGSASFTRAAAWTWAWDLDVDVTGAGQVIVTAPLTISNANATNFDLLSNGTLTFNGFVTHTNGDITNSGTAGTINFNGGYSLDNTNSVFTTMAGTTVNFGGSFTVLGGAEVFNATSIAVFNGGAPTITPTAAITFGNFQINSGITVTLAGNITVAGNWTNNGGTLSGGANTVTFAPSPSGTAMSIGGTSGTAFPNLNIGTAAVDAPISLTGGFTYSCINLTIDDGAAGGATTVNTLTHSSTEVLNVSGNANLIQPVANQTNGWYINAGTGSVTGTLSFTGTNNTTARIQGITVTSGSFTVTGAVSWMAQVVGSGMPVATEVISVATGTVTFGSSLSMPDGSGTFNVTGNGTINFNGAAAPSFNFFNGAPDAADINPVFTTSSGCTLNFTNGFTNSNAALVIANGSASVFTGSGTITPNAAITFGNVQINATPTVTLAGNISVTNNWTNLGGTFTPGTNTVTFNGTGTQTIAKTVSPPEIFYNLTSNTTGPLTLGSNVTVTNTLTMTAGNYNLNTFTLTLGNSAAATLVRTAGIMYDGTFRRWFPLAAISSTAAPLYGLFPIGTSTDYSPTEINSTVNPATAGYVSASFVNALTVTDVAYTDNEGASIERIHDSKSIMTTSGLAGGTYNIDITYTILSSTGFLTDMKLETYTGGVMGSVGTSAATAGTVPAPIVKRTGLTAAQLANDWVLSTINKTATPLRAIYYSIASGNWADAVSVWSLTDGGPACGCSPVADGYAIIRFGTTVTVAAPAAIDFVDIRNGGTVNGTANFTVNYDLTILGGSGAFSPSAGTWTVGRNVRLTGTSSSTTPSGSAMSITGYLNLGPGTSLTLSGALTVSGKLTVDGTLALGGFGLTLNGTGTAISSASSSITTSGGTPTITVTNNKTIESGTILTIGTVALPITLALSAATTVTNNGSITLNGSMTGAAGTSVWTQNPGATLNITDALLATGALNASASPNTVNYNGSVAQTIKSPASSYYNLTCSNAGTKSLAADVSVTNLVTIQGAAILDEAVDANDLSGAGGLTMTGTSELIVRNDVTATLPQLTGTYTLSAGTVTITRSAGTITVRGATYYNLILNGTGNHTCSSVTSITNNLTVSSTADILSNGILTVGNAITYSSTDADGWVLTNNVTASSYTMTAGIVTVNSPNIFTINGAGGWTKNGGTLAGTGEVQFTGTVAQPVGGTSSTTFFNLTINNTSATGVTLSQPITVGDGTAGTLTLTDGYLYSGAVNLLTMATGSSVSPVGGSATSFIDGPIAKTGTTDFIFPTGDDVAPAGAGAEDVWARIAVTSLSASETFTATYFFSQSPDFVFPPPSPLTAISAFEYWTLNRTGANNARVTLYWENATRSDIDNCPNVTVARFNGAVWGQEIATASGSCAPAGSGSVLTDGLVTAFSPFTLASRGGGNPLPIELLSFDAILNNNVVDLKWATAAEINNDYFTVEKTTNGKEFSEVAKVKAAGNSSNPINYKTIDENPNKGISYYRLKQTDYDGKFTYSELVAINNSERRGVEFIVFPNPTDGKNINVSFKGNENNEEILVVLNDIEGKQVYSKVMLTSDNGSFINAIDTENRLPAGIYLIIGSSRNDIYSRKLVIK